MTKVQRFNYGIRQSKVGWYLQLVDPLVIWRRSFTNFQSGCKRLCPERHSWFCNKLCTDTVVLTACTYPIVQLPILLKWTRSGASVEEALYKLNRWRFQLSNEIYVLVTFLERCSLIGIVKRKNLCSRLISWLPFVHCFPILIGYLLSCFSHLTSTNLYLRITFFGIATELVIRMILVIRDMIIVRMLRWYLFFLFLLFVRSFFTGSLSQHLHIGWELTCCTEFWRFEFHRHAKWDIT